LYSLIVNTARIEVGQQRAQTRFRAVHEYGDGFGLGSHLFGHFGVGQMFDATQPEGFALSLGQTSDFVSHALDELVELEIGGGIEGARRKEGRLLLIHAPGAAAFFPQPIKGPPNGQPAQKRGPILDDAIAALLERLEKHFLVTIESLIVPSQDAIDSGEHSRAVPSPNVLPIVHPKLPRTNRRLSSDLTLWSPRLLRAIRNDFVIF
jgi:hypothetical protein